jgi:hypothetical protein
VNGVQARKLHAEASGQDDASVAYCHTFGSCLRLSPNAEGCPTTHVTPSVQAFTSETRGDEKLVDDIDTKSDVKQPSL